MQALLLTVLLACGGSQTAPEAAPEPAPAVAPGDKPAEAPKADAEAPTEVDIAAFAKLKESGEVPVVVDVRTPEEWESGHVPGAVHIPMNEIQGRLSELDAYKDGPIYFICASGARSGRVSTKMRESGYQAVNVLGGTSGWKAAGHPVE